MSDQPMFNRRRVLELSGVGTGLAIAGCTGQLDDSELEGDERRVTIAIQPEQEALEALETEVDEEIEAGELDEQQAQIEFQQRQAALLQETFENVQTELEERDISIENTLQDQILLVTGLSADLIDALDIEGVGGLFGSEEFQVAEEQQEQQEEQQQQPPEQPPEDEEGDEPTQEELEEEIQEELEDAEAEDDEDDE